MDLDDINQETYFDRLKKENLCFVCKKPDHLARNCSNKVRPYRQYSHVSSVSDIRVSLGEARPHIEVRAGDRTLLALADSGAEGNFISNRRSNDTRHQPRLPT
jgi:hypothetical protein